MSSNKLWTRNFILISIANLFIALIFYLLMTTLTVYAITQFRASESLAGLVTSIFVIGALCSRFWAGKNLDTIGRAKMFRGSMILFFISSIFYFWADDVWLLLIVRFIHGAALGVGATAMSTIVMSFIPRDRLGEGTGYFTLSSTLATAIGPFLGVYLTDNADFDVIFTFCSLFALLSIVVAFMCGIPEVQLTEKQRSEMKSGFHIMNFFEKSALPIAVIMLLLAVCFSSIIAFINSYAIEIKLTKSAGYFFIVYACFILFTRPLAGKLLDRKGENIVFYPAMFSFAISFLLLSLAQSGAMLLSAGIFAAIGFGTLMPVAQAIVVRLVENHRVGLAISTIYIFLDAGMGFGPYLIGKLVTGLDYRGMYMIMAGVVLLTMVLYYFTHGRYKKRVRY